MPDAIRLNLGGGDIPLEGFIPIDRISGCELYPLRVIDHCGAPHDENYAVPDDSIDELYASHCLEHFGYGSTLHVLKEWVRVLKPGGTIKIAVPDFEWIVKAFTSNSSDDFPLERYLMGGQVDENDFHAAIFNRQKLTMLMEHAGLIDIKPWKSEIEDCARLPVSLNLMGTKGEKIEREEINNTDIAVVMSAPRLNFTDSITCTMQVIHALGLKPYVGQGVFWGQVLSRTFEEAIASGAKYLLTVDYDTLFTPQDVFKLCVLLRDNPDADAVCGAQMMREAYKPLFYLDRKKNADKTIDIDRREFEADLLPIVTGHFGLTLIRASSLQKLAHPWFQEIPDPEGKWGEKHVDPDIYFWRKWTESGLKLCQANRVVLGHLQLVATWPDQELKPVHQYLSEYRKSGRPEGVWE